MTSLSAVAGKSICVWLIVILAFTNYVNGEWSVLSCEVSFDDDNNVNINTRYSAPIVAEDNSTQSAHLYARVLNAADVSDFKYLARITSTNNQSVNHIGKVSVPATFSTSIQYRNGGNPAFSPEVVCSFAPTRMPTPSPSYGALNLISCDYGELCDGSLLVKFTEPVYPDEYLQEAEQFMYLFQYNNNETAFIEPIASGEVRSEIVQVRGESFDSSSTAILSTVHHPDGWASSVECSFSDFSYLDQPDFAMNLKISNVIFETSSHVLFHPAHGNHLFLQEFVARDNTLSINHDDSRCVDDTAYDQDQDQNEDTVQLFFDRSPSLFEHILDYLRGYDIQDRLYKLEPEQLQSLLDDAQYYQLSNLETLVFNSLSLRFNPNMCYPSTHISIEDNGRTLRQIWRPSGLYYHNSCAVYGVMYSGERYVEFQSLLTLHQFFGVTEAYPFIPSYPGRTNPGITGCAVYTDNGNLYANGASSSFTSAFGAGTMIGLFVRFNDDNTEATITFYKNGAKLNTDPINLNQYMDITKGIAFFGNVYQPNDILQIVQNHEIPADA